MPYFSISAWVVVRVVRLLDLHDQVVGGLEGLGRSSASATGSWA
jgi:hypothetical protein